MTYLVRRARLAHVTAWCLLLAAAAPAQTYAPASSYVAGTNPSQVAVGDLNGDGRPDLVVGSIAFQGSVVSVLLAEGSGFAAPVAFSAGAEPGVVALADLNGDGKLDLVAAHSSLTGSGGSGSVSVLLGNGAGGFAPPRTTSLGSRVAGIEVSDIDRNGRPDVVLSLVDRVILMRGDGAGGLAAPETITLVATRPGRPVLADFNRDGKIDLAFGTNVNFSGFVKVSLGDGAGGFAPPSTFPSGGSSALVVADVNLDGRIDAVCVGGLSDTGVVLLGDGAGGLGAPTTFATRDGGSTVVTGDFNDDGKPDLAIVGCPSSGFCGLSLLLGNGAGSFGLPVFVLGGSLLFSLTTADLNGDGRLDLLTSNLQSEVTVALATPRWVAASTFAAGTEPNSVTIADVNGDFRNDIVTANPSSSRAAVLLGNGAGGFATPILVPGGSRPIAAVIGDLNRDGTPDLVTADEGSLSVVVTRSPLLRGAVPRGFALNAAPTAIALGDFNGDGRPDVVAALFSTNRVALLLGDGAGGLSAAVTFAVGSGPRHLAVGDVDGDGRLDVVTANIAGNTVSLLRGNGLGGFVRAESYPAGVSPTAVAIADLDGDGHQDLIVANLGAPTLTLLFGRIQGGLTSRTVDLDFRPAFVTVGDVTGDGKLDLVATFLGVFPTGGRLVQVLPGDGARRFGAGNTIAVGDSPVAAALANLNGDGLLDIVTANRGANNVSVLLNQGLMPFGTGTPGCGGMLALTGTTTPRLNTPAFAIQCTNAPRQAGGVLLLGDRGDVLGSDLLGFGARFHLSAASTFLISVPITSDFTDIGRVTLPIPGNPSLLGGGYQAQAFWLENPATAPACSRALGLLASRGLAVRFLP